MFTSENAARNALLSVEARKRNIEAARKADEALLAKAQACTYVEDRLARVRVQLDRLDKMALEEIDPAKLDRLASAQARLAQQEQFLANRPSPGQLKPTLTKRQSTPNAMPIEPDMST